MARTTFNYGQEFFGGPTGGKSLADYQKEIQQPVYEAPAYTPALSNFQARGYATPPTAAQYTPHAGVMGSDFQPTSYTRQSTYEPITSKRFSDMPTDDEDELKRQQDEAAPTESPDDIVAGPDAPQAPQLDTLDPQIMTMAGAAPVADPAAAVPPGAAPEMQRRGFGGMQGPGGMQGGFGGMHGGMHHGWLQQLMQRMQERRQQMQAQRGDMQQMGHGGPMGWMQGRGGPPGAPTAAAAAQAQATAAAPPAGPAPAAQAPAGPGRPQQPMRQQAPAPMQQQAPQRPQMTRQPMFGGGASASIQDEIKRRMGAGGGMGGGGGRRMF